MFLYFLMKSLFLTIMVSVKVMFFARFREKFNCRETTLDFNGSLKGFFAALSDRFSPELVNNLVDSSDRIRDDLIVMINGRNIKDIKEGIKFKDGDKVAIFPPVGGG